LSPRISSKNGEGIAALTLPVPSPDAPLECKLDPIETISQPEEEGHVPNTKEDAGPDASFRRVLLGGSRYLKIGLASIEWPLVAEQLGVRP